MNAITADTIATGEQRGLSWFELSKLDDGTKVRFVEEVDRFPDVLIPAGATGTITTNNLNELACCLYVRPDDDEQRAALAHWEGQLMLGTDLDPGADAFTDPDWQAASPLVRA